MIGILTQSPLLFLFAAISLLLVITVHEFAHAFMADKLGDPTPRLQGRLTLNPLAHLDPIGTLAILLVGFGWGKPVQFDPYNLKDHRREAAIISLAGPFSNFVLASLASMILRSAVSLSLPAILIGFLTIFIQFNLVLAIFNLVPIHPLDGGKILSALLPKETSRSYDAFMYRNGLIILFLLLIFPFGGGSIIHTILGPVIDFFMRIYIPSSLFSIVT